MKRRVALVTWLAAASAFAQRTPPMPGEFVRVNGRNLHVDCRGKGPAVVFVNGIPRFSMDWILVQQEVAKFARACTWDRASEAWSDASEMSARATVNDLDKIVAYADPAGPVILVAHSAGGSLARVYASEQPQRVRALILVDAVPDNGARMAGLTDAQIADFAEQAKKRPAPGSPGIEPALRKLPEAAQIAHSWAAGKWWVEQGSQVAEGLRYQRDFGKMLVAATAKGLGKVPLVVIARAKSADEDSDWIKQQRKLAELSSASKLVLAVGSSHDIEVDDPGIIVTAIRSAIPAQRL